LAFIGKIYILLNYTGENHKIHYIYPDHYRTGFNKKKKKIKKLKNQMKKEGLLKMKKRNNKMIVKTLFVA
jgi:hypothetical protein